MQLFLLFIFIYFHLFSYQNGIVVYKKMPIEYWLFMAKQKTLEFQGFSLLLHFMWY